MLRTWCAFAGLCAGGCTFRGYFAPSGLVPLLRNGANRQRRTLLAECMHFQGLVRPFGARAAASGGANRHPRIAALSPFFVVRMWFSSDQSTKKKEMQKCISFFLVHFQGLLRPFGARAAASGGANRGFLSRKSTKKKRNANAFLFFLVHFQGLEPWAH